MNISWAPVEQQQWDRWHADTGGAIQQSWAYGSAICSAESSTVQCLRAVLTDDAQVVAVAQIIVRRIAGVMNFGLCSRGPLWLEQLDPTQRAEVFSLIKRSNPVRGLKLTFFSPDDYADNPCGTQKLQRVITGFSTVRLDLTQTPEKIRQSMLAKWRNRLVAAESTPLKVNRNGVKPMQYEWLLQREGAQRQEKSYYALPPNFVNAFQQASQIPACSMLMLRADLERDAVAAMMFLIHGSSATYHIGWSDARGREHSAHNLLLWQSVLRLKELGINSLDMGGVNTQRGAGIARFKLGTGGEVQTFSGTYC